MAGGLADSRDRDLIRQLRDAPAGLSRDLRRDLGQAGNQVAAKTRAKIRSAASRRAGSLREEIAGTVSVRGLLRRSGAAVEIKSDGTKMPDGKENLAAYADGYWPWQRWRHPVWGHDPWKTQEWPSARGWFSGTIRAESPQFAAAAQAAMNETAGRIEGRR
jgi:hypothetical protein